MCHTSASFSHTNMLRSTHTRKPVCISSVLQVQVTPSSSASFPTLLLHHLLLTRRPHRTRSLASTPDNYLSDKSFLMLSNHLRFGPPPSFFSPACASPSLSCLEHFFSTQYMPTPVQPTFLEMYPAFVVSLIIAFQIPPSVVTPVIHLNILISAMHI